MKTIFDPNYIDFLQLLKKNNVKYVMVGGLAVVMHAKTCCKLQNNCNGWYGSKKYYKQSCA